MLLTHWQYPVQSCPINQGFLFFNRAEMLQQKAVMIFAKCLLYSFALSFKSKPGRLVYLSGAFLFEFPPFRG